MSSLVPQVVLSACLCAAALAGSAVAPAPARAAPASERQAARSPPLSSTPGPIVAQEQDLRRRLEGAARPAVAPRGGA